MVKNHGGNKAKRQGRKFANETQRLVATRVSNDPDELYACCSKIFGNGMIEVLCQDNKERICVIRNKFRGRGKRGNKVEIGSWLLVGCRSFEKVAHGKKEKTDLLTVYSSRDIKNLKQKELQYATIFKEFEKFGSVDFDRINNEDDEHEIKFEETNDYYDGIDLPPDESDENSNNDNDTNNTEASLNVVMDEDINVDDI